MTKPRADVGRLRRTQIVEAAVAIIAGQGFDHLSLSAIEKRAGMSRGQLTYYFHTKEDILLAVFDHLLELMRARVSGDCPMESALQMPHGWERAQQFLSVLLLQPPPATGFHSLQYTFLSQIGHRDDFRQRLANLYEEWRRDIAEDLESDVARRPGHSASARTLATLVQAVLHGLAMQCAADPDAYDRHEMLELIVALLGSYLRPAAHSPRPAAKKSATNGRTVHAKAAFAPKGTSLNMNDMHAPPAPARVPAAASPNGQSSLSDRVRALRLKGSGGATAGPARASLLPWGLTVIALATAGVFGWRAYRVSPADASTAAADNAPAGTTGSPSSPAGSSDKANATPGEAVLDNKGIVVAPHTIQISPQVGGEIVWLDPKFREGTFYKKGDRLAEIDPVIYEAQLKNAKASLQVARVNLEQVKTGSTLKDIAAAKALLESMAAKLDWTKVDERNKRCAGYGTSADDLEKASIQLVIDAAGQENQKQVVAKLEALLDEQRRTAQAQVEAAQANVDQAQKQLKNCTILAPTTGIILTKKAELGGYVNPLAYSGVAGYLCEMADLLDLEIECDVQERDFKAVRIGQRCKIMPDAGQYDDEGFRKTHPDGYVGEVVRRLPVANPGKGAVTVRVKVIFPKGEKAGEFLIPNMGALVTFLK